MKILYSPIGQSDPVRSDHDGPWLHICRHIKPDMCMLYLTKAMCNIEESEHLYTEAMKLMNDYLLEKGEIRKPIKLEFSYHPEITEPDISDEEFYKGFEKDLRALHELPGAEIYYNSTSGTPVMQACLEALSNFLEFPVRNCYVRNVKKQVDADNKDRITEKAPAALADMIPAWKRNEDNLPGAKCRLVRKWEKAAPLSIKLVYSQLQELVRGYDYSGALKLIEKQGPEFPKANLLTAAFKGAEARMRLDLTSAGNWLQKAGLSETGTQLKKYESDELRRCGEMLLTMEVDCKRGDLANMLRKVTPVLYKLTEMEFTGLGFPLNTWLGPDGKMVSSKVEEELRGYLFPLDKYKVYPSTDNLLNAMSGMKKFGPNFELLKELRDKVESGARNMAAHQLPSITEKWIQSQTKLSAEEIIEKLWTVLFSQGGEKIGKSYRKSYETMNKEIENLLR